MERLEKFNDPRLIPLPPSPPPRIRIPSRRPQGWITTLNDDQTDDRATRSAPSTRQAEGNAVSSRAGTAALGHGRPSTASRSNVRASSSGRRVSSALQYALIAQTRSASRSASASQDAKQSAPAEDDLRRPSTPLPPHTPALTDARSASESTAGTSLPQTPVAEHTSFARIRSASATSVLNDDADEPRPERFPVSPSTGAADSSLDRPEWLDEVLEERRADEEWMGYVRAQLGALFPDFVDAPDGAVIPEEEPLDNPGWTNENASDAGRQLLNNVPSVRSEISELRDELERLRGVVGGLANGLSPPASRPAGGEPSHVSEASQTADAADEEDRAAVEGLLEDKQDLDDALSKVSRPTIQLTSQHRETIVEILQSLSLVFPRVDQQDRGTACTPANLLHLRDSLRNHLA